MAGESTCICGVITEQTTEGASRALRDAAAKADIAELRLDYLRDFDFQNLDALKDLLHDKPLPVIITCRDIEEGGHQFVETTVRLRLLVEGAREYSDFCDIEAAHYAAAASLSPDLSKLIVSHHDFGRTPADLERVYERVTAMPAAAHKIVTHANDVSDCLPILKLLKRAENERRRLIALAMGSRGLLTRVLACSRGSFLTYGALEANRESAPGQPTCDELSSLYRVRHLSKETKIAGVIGNPIGHSASPAMHNHAFTLLGLNFVYLPFEVPDLRSFFEFVRRATNEFALKFVGFSVTIPHKTSILSLLDEVDPVAGAVGAANTVVIDSGKLIGYNTDVDGVIQPLEHLISLKDKHCAVLGAGGAARAVVYGLVQSRARVTVFARDVSKAQPLATMGADVMSLDTFAKSDAQIVINATSLGMRGHKENSSPVPRQALAGRLFAYDLVYNPLQTRFLTDARLEGCQILGGVEMLVSQAARQFEIWTGTPAPSEVMREAALVNLRDQPLPYSE